LITANEKFDTTFDYHVIANYCRKIESVLFGKKTKEFQCLLDIFNDMKAKNLNYYCELKLDSDNVVENAIFTSQKMLKLYNEFSDVLILDTTFGTNRYKISLKFQFMILKL